MDDQRLRPWTIVASDYRIDEPYLRLRADRIELADGTIVEQYFVRETRGFTIVAAVTRSREIVLVRQYKHGIGRIILELPAGIIDADESAADCAVRELAEETGYAGDPPRLLRTVAPDPTNSTGTCSIFLIENAELKTSQSLDVTETIVVETVPVDRFAALLRSDADFFSAPHVAAGYILLDELGML
jgi:8-oxo-dGTP pyrophosphatase MutT (NUDIX family)